MAVLTMDGAGDVLEKAEIAVKGNEIYHVGAAGATPPDFKPGRVLDCPGLVAMPGFVNCHTHAAMTLFRGYADDMPLMSWLKEKIWPLEKHLTPEHIYKGAQLCCAEMVRGGTTTFADMYFAMDRVAQAVEESGLRAVLCRGMIGLGPGAEQSMRESKEFIARWHGGADGRVTAMFGPHAPYTCPPEYLERVIEAAEEAGVGIHIHLAETRDEINEIMEKYGRSPVVLMEETGLFKLPVLAAHCVHLDDRDIEILAGRRVGIAHNPQSNMKLASGVAPVTKLLEAGALVGLGTDGAASNNNLDMMEEMRAAALLQKVHTQNATALPAGEMLRMATAGGAEVLGLGDRVGRIAPGMLADIILIDMRKPHLYPLHDLYAHIAYAAVSSDVHTVIVDGKVVMENRLVMTLDEDAVLAGAQAGAESLIRAKEAEKWQGK
ncbi:MAG: amidohydrolase [Firmicutes bacterium]|nr:amidohydrolase [Bacillota bacterium]